MVGALPVYLGRKLGTVKILEKGLVHEQVDIFVWCRNVYMWFDKHGRITFILEMCLHPLRNIKGVAWWVDDVTHDVYLSMTFSKGKLGKCKCSCYAGLLPANLKTQLSRNAEVLQSCAKPRTRSTTNGHKRCKMRPRVRSNNRVLSVASSKDSMVTHQREHQGF
eukprot:409939-Amphidinium_carterae.2